MSIDCKYLLDGRFIGRPCTKDENMSCRYWGAKPWCEEQEITAEDMRFIEKREINWDEINEISRTISKGYTPTMQDERVGQDSKMEITFDDDDGEPQ